MTITLSTTTSEVLVGTTTGTDQMVYSREMPDPDQSYFFTSGWQDAVLRAEADLAAGRIATFDTVEDLLADLGL